jgi:Raf kinase inhibitor-like YbhB/YbcL family protein
VPFRLTSPAFEPGAAIPARYACDGDDVSPPLRWEDPPAETAALALIVEDPDAPRGTFTHWIGWGLPPVVRELPEGVEPPAAGRNDFGSVGYRGPCPPPGHGVHRYFFRLYALTAEPELEPGASAREFHDAITTLIVDATELVGTYRR